MVVHLGGKSLDDMIWELNHLITVRLCYGLQYSRDSLCQFLTASVCSIGKRPIRKMAVVRPFLLLSLSTIQ